MKMQQWGLLLSLSLWIGACGYVQKGAEREIVCNAVGLDTVQPRESFVDQSAGSLVIEALSKVYGDDPNVVGGFIGSSRCPSFLEGMFFEGATLVFQVRGDTVQARRILEAASGSRAFRLEQITEGNYSQRELEGLMDEINRRVERLEDKSLAANLAGYGVGLHHIDVNFVLNTPEARQSFREKIMDSPAIRFNGPEEPELNPMVGVSDTLGISLYAEYSVFSTQSETASFVLLNESPYELTCGAAYFVTYEDEQGMWRTLPIHTAFIAIAYGISPGGHRSLTANLLPQVHRNRAGRYRFFYTVSIEEQGRDFDMMAEFRLTDDEQEVRWAVRK